MHSHIGTGCPELAGRHDPSYDPSPPPSSPSSPCSALALFKLMTASAPSLLLLHATLDACIFLLRPCIANSAKQIAMVRSGLLLSGQLSSIAQLQVLPPYPLACSSNDTVSSSTGCQYIAWQNSSNLARLMKDPKHRGRLPVNHSCTVPCLTRIQSAYFVTICLQLRGGGT